MSLLNSLMAFGVVVGITVLARDLLIATMPTSNEQCTILSKEEYYRPYTTDPYKVSVETSCGSFNIRHSLLEKETEVKTVFNKLTIEKSYKLTLKGYTLPILGIKRNIVGAEQIPTLAVKEI